MAFILTEEGKRIAVSGAQAKPILEICRVVATGITRNNLDAWINTDENKRKWFIYALNRKYIEFNIIGDIFTCNNKVMKAELFLLNRFINNQTSINSKQIEFLHSQGLITTYTV